MSYFRELPDFEYIANFSNQSFNTDYVVTKNIFKRAKLRDDIANAVTAFNYYQIIDSERPDQIAQKIYNNSDLDWVILITNNITNINDQWPLDNNSFYKYLIDKYGGDDKIAEVHHYETIETRDEYNRLIVQGGLQIDPPKTLSFTTNNTDTVYNLTEFPDENLKNKITINLNQFVPVYGNTENTQAIVKDITKDISLLKIEARGNKTPITIANSLETWPNSWGGSLVVKGRNENTIIQVSDIIFENDVILDKTLYEIVGEEQNGQIVPVFRFLQQYK